MALLRRSAVFLAAVCFLAVCHVSVDGAAAAGPRTTAATRLKKTQTAPSAQVVEANTSDRREMDVEAGTSPTYSCQAGYYVYGLTDTPAATLSSIVCPNSFTQPIAGASNAACCPCTTRKTYTPNAACSVARVANGSPTSESLCCRSCGPSTNLGLLDLGYNPTTPEFLVRRDLNSSATNAFCPCRGGFGNGNFGGATAITCVACTGNTITPPNPNPAGFHVSGSTQCMPCPPGTLANATKTACETIVCPLNQYLDPSSNTCRNCGAGTASRPDSNQQAVCPCLAGFGSFSQSTATCSACSTTSPSWQFSIGGVGAVCASCGPNTDGPTAGGNSCKCKVGTGNPLAPVNNQAYDCAACASGSFSAGWPMTQCRVCSAANPNTAPTFASGSVNPSTCQCNVGYGGFARVGAVAADAAYACTQCAAGTYAANNICNNCLAGTFNPSAGQTGIGACRDCPSATNNAATFCPGACVAVGTNPALNNQCCAAGQKVAEGAQPGTYTCVACESGTSTLNLPNGNATCTACLPGTYSVAISATEGALVCTPCSAGFASSNPALACDVETNRCSQAIGQYSGPGAAVCSTCNDATGGYAVSTPIAGCMSCPAGQRVTSARSGCTNCVAGFFSASANVRTICDDCGVGTISSAPNAQGCATCLSGTFANAAGTACLPCGPGTDTAGASGRDVTSSPACTPCVLGTFKNGTSADSCRACPAGFVPNVAKDACVPCGAGTFANPSTFVCSPCASGSVASGAANAQCTPCVAGQFARSSDQTCQSCASGFFSTTPRTDACDRCPTNFVAKKDGASPTSQANACEQCVDPLPFAAHPSDPLAAPLVNCTGCGVNQFFPVTQDIGCTSCEAGQQSVNREIAVVGARSASCTSCPVGTTSAAGASCVACSAGTFSSPQTPAIENAGAPGDAGQIRVCNPCAAGTVFGPTQGSSSQCYTCTGNQFFVSANADCASCTNGFVTPASGVPTGCTICPPNTRYNGVGGVGQAAACTDCPTNRVSNGGTTTCEFCPAGFEKSLSNPGQCSPCAAGTFRAAGTDGACTKCPTGTYSTGGAAVCTACGNGQRWTEDFSATVNFPTSQAACTACPAGFVSNADAWTNNPVAGGYTCTECTSVGEYAIAGQATCATCSPPLYVTSDNAQCIPCNVDFQAVFQTGPLTTTDNSCTACSTQRKSPGGDLCSLCPAGQQRRIGFPNACEACPAGTYRATGTEDNACLPCPANFFCPAPVGAFGTITPTACAANVYAPPGSDAANDCAACPVNNVVIAGICTPCPAGYFGAGGTSACQLCPSGRAGTGAGNVGVGCVNCGIVDNRAFWSPVPSVASPNVACSECLQGSLVALNGQQQGFACTACPAGTYHAFPLAATCTNCGQGQSTNGLDARTACSRCEAGSYAAVQGTPSCTLCNPGRWAAPLQTPLGPFGANSDNACLPCPAGRFSGTPGKTAADEISACTACTAGFAQATPGSSTCNTPCTRGTYSAAAASSCTQCSAGRAAPIAGQANDCVPCASGRFSNTPAGTDPFLTSVGIASSTLAEMNTASSVTLTASVLPVDAVGTGRWSFRNGPNAVAGCNAQTSATCSIPFANLGASSTNAFTVLFTPNANTAFETTTSGVLTVTLSAGAVTAVTAAVPAVAPETTMEWPNLASCTKCSLGTFASGTANRLCFNCAPGRIAASEGTATCSPCGQNTFSNAAQGTSCTVCPVGTTTYEYTVSGSTYVTSGSSTGTPAATTCFSCPTGWAREFAFAETLCSNCGAGRFAFGLGAVCSSCAAGKYGAQVPAGPNPPIDAVRVAGCVACENGKFAPTISSLACTNCPRGRAVTGVVDGASICAACTAGRFQDLEGEATCKPCAAGTFSTTTERSVACDPCAAGKFSTEGLSSCSDCPPSQFQNLPGQGNCTVCPAGKSISTPATAFTVCNDCGVGRFKTVPTVNAADCEVCPEGTFKATAGGVTCDLCPRGTFRAAPLDQSTSSGLAAASCTRCPPGRAAIIPAAPLGQTTEAGACRTCPIGTYSFMNVTGEVVCADCPAGRWNDQPGQASCTPCEQGRYGLLGETGQITKDYDVNRLEPGTQNLAVLKGACRRCPRGRASTSIGLTSATEAGACTACLKGTYQDQTGQLQCAGCALGRFSAIDEATICSNCIPGRYAHQVGLTECFGCAIGKYISIPSATDCLDCDASTLKFAAVEGMSFCHGCFAGRYGNITGGGVNTTDLTSPATLTSQNFFDHNLNFSDGDMLHFNEFGPENFDGAPSGCMKCDGGLTSPNSTANVASTDAICNIICADRLWSEAGDSACSVCGGNRLPPGAGTTPPLPNGGYDNCKGCPAGSYGPVDAATCTVCTIPGFTTVLGQARFVTDCGKVGCPVGFFWQQSDSTCIRCPENQWAVANNTMTNCTLCPENTERAAADLQLTIADSPISMCKSCVTPKVSVAGGSCGLCPVVGEGIYNATSTTACVLCNVAADPLFQYRYRETVAGDTQGFCVFCAAGYEINAADTGCDICPAGEFRPAFNGTFDSDCLPCEADKYTPTTGSGNANPALGWATCDAVCPPGSVVNPTKDGCVQCPIGSVELPASPGTCTLCTGNDYIGLAGQTACLQAAVGYIGSGANPGANPPTGNNGVTGCGVGKFRNATQTDCTACPPGRWYYDLDNMAMPNMPAQGVDMCPLCLIGTFKAADNLGACVACPGGTFPNLENPLTPEIAPSTKCEICTDGQRTNSAATACEACPPTTYRKYQSVEDSGDNQGKCLPCAPDADTPALVPGSIGATFCSCKPGFTRRASDFMGSNPSADRNGSKCINNNCAEGQWLSQVGGIGRCIDCAAGTYCNKPNGCGTGGCMPCNARATSLDGAAQCRCLNTGSSYLEANIADPFGYIPLGSGDQPGMVADPDTMTGNVDNGAACLPACNQGQFFVTGTGISADVTGSGSTVLTAYQCYDAPAGFFCPKFMTFGCAGSTVESALEVCHPNAEALTRASQKCTCKTGFTDLDGSADGSGCVPTNLVTRR